MKQIFLILNKPELLEEVIEYLVEEGVSGATVVDTVGMGKILAYDIPIFAGFRELMVGAKATNKMIITTVADDLLEHLMEGLDRIIEFDQPGTGVAMVTDIYKTYGIKER